MTIVKSDSEFFEKNFNAVQARKAKKAEDLAIKRKVSKKRAQKALASVENLQISQLLDDLVEVGFDNEGKYVAEQACPVVTVEDPVGSFWVVPFEETLRDILNDGPAERAQPKETFSAQDMKSYSTSLKSISEVVTREKKNALTSKLGNGFGQVIDYVTRMTGKLENSLYLNREIRFKDILVADSSYTAANRASAPTVKWDQPTADIIEDIMDKDVTIQSKTGAPQNSKFINKETFVAIKNSPDFLDRITEGARMGMASQNVKDVDIGILEGLTGSAWYVMESVVNSSPFNVDPVIDWILPDGIYSCYLPATSGRELTSSFALFANNGLEGFNGMGMSMEGPIELRETERTGNDKYIVELYDGFEVINTNYGWKYDSVIN